MLAGVVLTAAVTIGEHVVVMPNVTLTHDCVLQDYSTVVRRRRPRAAASWSGTAAYVGMNASVRQSVHVGEHATLGMGAVLLTDQPDHETWAGVPARALGPTVRATARRRRRRRPPPRNGQDGTAQPRAAGQLADRDARGHHRGRGGRTMRIPLVDLGAQQREIDDEVTAGLAEVFGATAFIGGPAVGRFEAAYAQYVGATHCVGVANGTDAIELALRAVGVRPGGEVILPANTFIATAEAVSRLGGVPVLVDVDPVHLLIDPAAVRAAVGPRTEAIVPVHLFGQTAAVEEIGKIAADAGVPMVEDAAQAQGARRAAACRGVVRAGGRDELLPGQEPGCGR